GLQIIADLVLETDLIVYLDTGADGKHLAPPLPLGLDLFHVGVIIEIVHDRIVGIEILMLGKTDLVEADFNGLLALLRNGRFAIVRTERVNLIVHGEESCDHTYLLLVCIHQAVWAAPFSATLRRYQGAACGSQRDRVSL